MLFIFTFEISTFSATQKAGADPPCWHKRSEKESNGFIIQRDGVFLFIHQPSHFKNCLVFVLYCCTFILMGFFVSTRYDTKEKESLGGIHDKMKKLAKIIYRTSTNSYYFLQYISIDNKIRLNSLKF